MAVSSTKDVLDRKPVAVFAWGPNSYGQLGDGDTDDVLKPTVVDGFPPCVRFVIGGGGHTFVITDDEGVYACGWNTKGQLGIPDLKDGKVRRLLHVPSLQGYRVVSMAAGWDFTLMCTDSGNLYAWGSNAYGQLGCPKVNKSTPSPTQVKVSGHVKAVAAGLRHSMALTADGKLLSWGSGKKGQLGILLEGKPPAIQPEPTRVPLPEAAGQVVQIVCGAYHSSALTDRGQVYVWGDNKHGQMALPVCETRSVPLPRQVSSFSSQVLGLCSGWTHLLVLTDQHLLSWGRNHYGQLGRDTAGQGHDHNPKVISLGVKDVKQVICGSEHNMVLKEGRLYTWGWNEHGICGTGDELNVAEPREVALLTNYHISLIGSGDGHSFALGHHR